MSLTEENIKKKIFRLVSDYYAIKHKDKVFIPGKSKVHYAGRVFDEKEIISLVDSALDFWLTAGRFADEFEKRFSEFIGVKYSLLTNSGSSANLLGLSALTSFKLGGRRLKLNGQTQISTILIGRVSSTLCSVCKLYIT